MNDPAALAGAPLGALDEAWEDALRALAADDRDSWLAAADALRLAEGPDHARARAVYWALRDELDPGEARDVPRILHVLRSGLERGPEFERLAYRAASARDGRLRTAAALCVAQCRSVAGQFSEAELRLRELLPDVRGTGSRLERTAYASLAVVYQNQGREFEALVLTRTVLRLSTNSEDPWEACVAHQQHCALLDALGDWDRMDEALDDLTEALRVADPPWAWTMWRYIHGQRAEAALEREDIEQARRSVKRMHEVVPPGTDDVAVPSWHPLLAARLALAEGRPAAALEYVAQALEDGERDAGVVAVRAALELGESELAIEHARRSLEQLQGEREVWGGAARRLRTAAGLAELLEDEGLAPAEARRAYEMAAEAATHRILELDHTMAALPDLAEVDAADLKALESFRLRFRERHARLFDRLAGYAPDEFGRAAFALAEGHVRVCAWCYRIASRAEQWLPAGHLLPARAGPPVTHTICPECVAAHGFE